MWKADTDLINECSDLFRQTLEDFHNLPHEDLLAGLEAVGTLWFLNQSDTALSLLANADQSTIADFKNALHNALSQEDWEEIDDTVGEIIARLHELRDDEGSEGSEEILDLFNPREKLGLCMAGCEALEINCTQEMVTAKEVFDDVLSEEAWLLPLLGDDRATNCIWAAPENRQRLWWASKGLGVNAQAPRMLEDVASLIYNFPQARQAIEEMIEVEEDLNSIIES